MGQLGQKQGASRAVKELSKRLIEDHTKTNHELLALARDKDVPVSMDGKSVVPAELSSKSGAEFDREFAKLMISDHQKDIAEFEKETRSGSDPDVKAWANRTLGTLRAHLQAAKALPELAMK
jgi:putative membrane protein